MFLPAQGRDSSRSLTFSTLTPGGGTVGRSRARVPRGRQFRMIALSATGPRNPRDFSRSAVPVTNTQLTRWSFASVAEHSGASHPLACGNVVHEVCHFTPGFRGFRHGPASGWGEADRSGQMDDEAGEVGYMVGWSPAVDDAVTVQAQMQHEDFVSGHDLVGGPVGGLAALNRSAASAPTAPSINSPAAVASPISPSRPTRRTSTAGAATRSTRPNGIAW